MTRMTDCEMCGGHGEGTVGEDVHLCAACDGTGRVEAPMPSPPVWWSTVNQGEPMTPPTDTLVSLDAALDAVWAVRRGYEVGEASAKGRQACDRIATALMRLRATQDA